MGWKPMLHSEVILRTWPVARLWRPSQTETNSNDTRFSLTAGSLSYLIVHFTWSTLAV